VTANSEPEVSEITDFTTASELKRFISKAEDVLNDWKLTNTSFICFLTTRSSLWASRSKYTED
uniref:Uncharacterized protein n=1 Tax=Anolis carolinensis TaxID=28377 RepID=A0A803TY19_ANOCA